MIREGDKRGGWGCNLLASDPTQPSRKTSLTSITRIQGERRGKEKECQGFLLSLSRLGLIKQPRAQKGQALS